MRRLLDDVNDYYPHLLEITEERDCTFSRELVTRTANLAAQWLMAGFCHGVLNIDNMAITSESFDYDPSVFWSTMVWDLQPLILFIMTARPMAINQPAWNLEELQIPLPLEEMQAALKTFGDRCQTTYLRLMLKCFGWTNLPLELGRPLVAKTQAFLRHSTISYPQFFVSLQQEFSPQWAVGVGHIFCQSPTLPPADQKLLDPWKKIYFELLQQATPLQQAAIAKTLEVANPPVILIRPQMEYIWQALDQEDDWSRFAATFQLMQV
ncbi:MAG: protein adenylyltransferase SelO family protein [Thermosynechococcus sp. Uc]|uniref:protein adenylyltransferase SelO family protein n=1 Tax=Thermosynechococcus sp. Uc TaxID=3034853 RepID=UPI00259E454F|nr:protein adenylyltransferase SelO family protein [Thermosynechococcus sp. Uc]MDM7327615.1 protein adenylyltransferase SelO family protein [Thermosynechococcus sp. Uc]